MQSFGVYKYFGSKFNWSKFVNIFQNQTELWRYWHVSNMLYQKFFSFISIWNEFNWLKLKKLIAKLKFQLFIESSLEYFMLKTSLSQHEKPVMIHSYVTVY